MFVEADLRRPHARHGLLGRRHKGSAFVGLLLSGDGSVVDRCEIPFTHGDHAGEERLQRRLLGIAFRDFVTLAGVKHATSGKVRGTLANIKVATFDSTRLRYVGAVGTGPSDPVADLLRERLNAIVTAKCSVAGLKGKAAVWVSPDLRAEIGYRGLRSASELRHVSFKGLVE